VGSVPRFKAGAGFSDVVSGAKKLPKVHANAKAAGTIRTRGRAATGAAADAAGAAVGVTRRREAITESARSGARSTGGAGEDHHQPGCQVGPDGACRHGDDGRPHRGEQAGTEQDRCRHDRRQRHGGQARSGQDRRCVDPDDADGRPEGACQEELSRSVAGR
jgi:hypothetical protein